MPAGWGACKRRWTVQRGAELGGWFGVRRGWSCRDAFWRGAGGMGWGSQRGEGWWGQSGLLWRVPPARRSGLSAQDAEVRAALGSAGLPVGLRPGWELALGKAVPPTPRRVIRQHLEGSGPRRWRHLRTSEGPGHVALLRPDRGFLVGFAVLSGAELRAGDGEHSFQSVLSLSLFQVDRQPSADPPSPTLCKCKGERFCGRVRRI